jgi:hypothetical protein
MVALTDGGIITISLAGTVITIGLLILLRILFRKEPSPPSWLRFRIGLFMERDPRARDDDPPPP